MEAAVYKRDEDGEEWSVAYVQPPETRLKRV